MFPRFILLSVAAFSTLGLSVPVQERQQPILPTEDSFYKISYRTNDNFGKALSTVLTVLVPYKADYTKGLSYQVTEDAAYAGCAPSYALQFASATGGPLGTIVTQAELLLIEAALEQGWVVISPDHEGPDAAYLANKLAGYATLDGIRAAINSANFTGISKSPTVGMWGYSGGSIASAAAAELQQSYAPELRIAGAVLGGTVPNITSVIKSINKGPLAGIIPPGMIGLSKQYPILKLGLDAGIKPEYKAKFDAVGEQCFVADVLSFLGQDVVGMLKDPAILTQEPAKSILDENALGKNSPSTPLFVYKSIQDQVSPIKDTDDLVKFYCSGGTKVQYDRDLLSEHGSLAIIGAGKALAWLKDIMNGRKGPSQCKTSNVVSSLLDLRGSITLSAALIEALVDLVGKPVGPIIG
ncbi:lipase 2 [Fusarium phyllophilum]|uniref:Lipase 2 n=1 Tax=Fusarium phyllophilum TaxID=47803 RepID=A0A8H5K7Y3_9HYPO|nr:lipase 2 [Fusarium phyllophilum]